MLVMADFSEWWQTVSCSTHLYRLLYGGWPTVLQHAATCIFHLYQHDMLVSENLLVKSSLKLFSAITTTGSLILVTIVESGQQVVKETHLVHNTVVMLVGLSETWDFSWIWDMVLHPNTLHRGCVGVFNTRPVWSHRMAYEQQACWQTQTDQTLSEGAVLLT